MQAAVYTTREVARLAKLSVRHVYALAHAGLVGERAYNTARRASGSRRRRGDHDAPTLRLNFRDLLVLRMAAELLRSGVGVPRMQWALRTLQRQLDTAAPLCRARIAHLAGSLVAQLGDSTWDLKTGQCLLPLCWRSPGSVATLPGTTQNSAAPPQVDIGSAEPSVATRLFGHALDLEAADPQAAYASYLQVLAFDPEHVEAMINVGRLCSAHGDPRRAAAYFRQAVRADPAHPVAHFNLAVMHHDLGEEVAAVRAYERALSLDPRFADAYFNLATLLQERGEHLRARQYMRAYEQLCQPATSNQQQSP